MESEYEAIMASLRRERDTLDTIRCMEDYEVAQLINNLEDQIEEQQERINVLEGY